MFVIAISCGGPEGKGGRLRVQARHHPGVQIVQGITDNQICGNEQKRAAIQQLRPLTRRCSAANDFFGTDSETAPTQQIVEEVCRPNPEDAVAAVDVFAGFGSLRPYDLLVRHRDVLIGPDRRSIRPEDCDQAGQRP
jgi:hypothetical protein